MFLKIKRPLNRSLFQCKDNKNAATVFNKKTVAACVAKSNQIKVALLSS